MREVILYHAECLTHGVHLYSNCRGCDDISRVHDIMLRTLRQYQTRVNAQGHAHIRLPGDD